MRSPNPKVELASGEYDRRKVKGFEPGLAPVARQFDIPVNKLANYRANYISRKERLGGQAGAWKRREEAIARIAKIPRNEESGDMCLCGSPRYMHGWELTHEFMEEAQ